MIFCPCLCLLGLFWFLHSTDYFCLDLKLIKVHTYFKQWVWICVSTCAVEHMVGGCLPLHEGAGESYSPSSPHIMLLFPMRVYPCLQTYSMTSPYFGSSWESHEILPSRTSGGASHETTEDTKRCQIALVVGAVVVSSASTVFKTQHKRHLLLHLADPLQPVA